MKKTKMICTIGPASEQKDVMREIIKTGMNVVRMNFSHGDYEEHGFRIKNCRELNEELGTNVALCLDTKGPEIRTHLFQYKEGEKKVTVEKGATVRIAMKEVLGTAEKFSVTYPGLYDDVKVGGTVLVDDGYLELTVVEKDEANRELVCRAENTHKIKDKRGINVPNVILNMPFISAKDKADMEFACDQDLDFISASFVRRASDVLEIREILKNKGNDHIKIIAKIENQEGVDNLDEIIEVADGIMVARGDMGVEIPAWEVPAVQKELVSKCQSQGKIVVVATQMLESMQNNPRPTRAEVNDVANAVLDGADSTMLSGESAGGDYPVQSVRYMAKINERMGDEIDFDLMFDRALDGVYELDFPTMLGMSAAKSALEFGATAIITVGEAKLASACSRFRPCCPIVACVPNRREARGLALNFGVFAFDFDLNAAIDYVKANNEVEEGDFVLVVTDKEMKVVEL